MTEEVKEKNLKEKAEAAYAYVEEQKKEKEKKWRWPFTKRVGKRSVKKGWIYVVHVNGNLSWDLTKKKVEDGVIVHNGIPFFVLPEYVMTYKGRPAIILNEASIEPYNPQKHIDEAIKGKMRSTGFKAIVAKMEAGTIKDKKGGGIGIWIILGIIVIGGAYYLFKGGNFSFS